jgi:diamine N-acetyltransferase
MSKRQLGPIVEGRIRLRLLQQGDLPMTLRWRNQDEIRKWFLNSAVIAWEQHRQWYEQYQARDDDFVFVIETGEASWRPVGQVALYHVDGARREAEFGRLLIAEPSARGKGFAREALEGVVRLAFGPLGLEEVYLRVRAENDRAVSLYLKSGFQVTNREGAVLTMRRRFPAAAPSSLRAG